MTTNQKVGGSNPSWHAKKVPRIAGYFFGITSSEGFEVYTLAGTSALRDKSLPEHQQRRLLLKT